MRRLWRAAPCRNRGFLFLLFRSSSPERVALALTAPLYWKRVFRDAGGGQSQSGEPEVQFAFTPPAGAPLAQPGGVRALLPGSRPVLRGCSVRRGLSAGFIAVQPQRFQELSRRPGGVQRQAESRWLCGQPLRRACPMPRPAGGSAVGRGACVTCSGFCLLIPLDSGSAARRDPLLPPPHGSRKGWEGMTKVLTLLSEGFLQNFATVWRVAQVQTVSGRLGAHMTRRKRGCKQALRRAVTMFPLTFGATVR